MSAKSAEAVDKKWLTRICVSRGILSGRVAGAHGLDWAKAGASFGKAGCLGGKNRPPSKNKLYQKIKICQVANKWFGCRKLEREKLLPGMRLVERLLSCVFAMG